MNIIDFMFATAPMPSDYDIESQQRYDRQRNPHNEPYHNKPAIRERDTIIADLKMKSVLEQIKRMTRIQTFVQYPEGGELQLRLQFEQYVGRIDSSYFEEQ